MAVHEFHVWQLSGSKIIASAHIRCHNLADYMRIAERVKDFFHHEGIHSTTIQPEFIDVSSRFVFKKESMKQLFNIYFSRTIYFLIRRSEKKNVFSSVGSIAVRIRKCITMIEYYFIRLHSSIRNRCCGQPSTYVKQPVPRAMKNPAGDFHLSSRQSPTLNWWSIRFRNHPIGVDSCHRAKWDQPVETGVFPSKDGFFNRRFISSSLNISNKIKD